MKTVAAIVFASERDPRFGASLPRHQMSLNGTAVIDLSLCVLRRHCDEVMVCPLASSESSRLEGAYEALVGMERLGRAPKFVVFHDASRPFVTDQQIVNIIQKLEEGCESVTAAVPIEDEVLVGGRPSPGAYAACQTPEGFPFQLFRQAFEWAAASGRKFSTASSLLWSWRGITPTTVEGFSFSGNILYPSDLAMAEGILKFSTLKPPPLAPVEGLNILLLGGSGGIGSACHRALRSMGAIVCAPTRSEVDLAQRNSFDLDPYQAVIHSAGAYMESPETIMQVNFFSCVNLLNCAKRLHWRGNLVFLSSTAATMGRPGIPVYSASKAALNALIEAEASMLASEGIYVNAVAPAKTNTRLQAAINPNSDPSTMIDPNYVAGHVLSYLRTKRFGEVLYIRKGLDV